MNQKTTIKTETKRVQIDENHQFQDMWKDPVFVSRQQELQKLSRDFSQAIDTLIINKPLSVDPAFIDADDDESYYDFNEEEEEEDYLETQKVGTTLQEQALLLMYEIDQMKKDTYQLISWFRSSAIKKNTKLLNMKNGLENLINYIDSLRMRAESLISV